MKNISNLEFWKTKLRLTLKIMKNTIDCIEGILYLKANE